MMTSGTLTQLQELARTMPRFHQRSTQRLTGQELMEMGYTHLNGHRINPEDTYTVPVIKETNQVRMLARIYKAHGYRAVLQHVYRYMECQTPDQP